LTSSAHEELKPQVIDLSIEEDDETTEEEEMEEENIHPVLASLPKVTRDLLKAGLQVTVLGENRVGHKFRRGGVGHITNIHSDGTVTVKFPIEGGSAPRVDLSNLALGAHPTLYGMNMPTAAKSDSLVPAPKLDSLAARKLRGVVDTSNHATSTGSGMKPVYRVSRETGKHVTTRTSTRRTSLTLADQ
jgi:hypothetical protein